MKKLFLALMLVFSLGSTVSMAQDIKLERNDTDPDYTIYFGAWTAPDDTLILKLEGGLGVMNMKSEIAMYTIGTKNETVDTLPTCYVAYADSITGEKMTPAVRLTVTDESSVVYYSNFVSVAAVCELNKGLEWQVWYMYREETGKWEFAIVVPKRRVVK